MKKEKNLWIIYWIVIIIIATVSLCACQSKSGHLNDQPLEKVVILEQTNTIDLEKAKVNVKTPIMYQYRIKRIEKGVTDIIYEYSKFRPGDTIFHRFIPN